LSRVGCNIGGLLQVFKQEIWANAHEMHESL